MYCVALGFFPVVFLSLGFNSANARLVSHYKEKLSER